MKRKLLLLSVCALTAFAANAQQAWHVQNSGFAAASRGINDFDVVDSNVVWAVAYDGSGGGATIRDYTVTTDGGATWLPGKVNATGLIASHGLANISAIDKDTAYASVYPGSASGIATQGVYKTTDGGATWAKVSAGTFTANASFINVVHFFDAMNGVAIGDPEGGYFEGYTTDNAGASWTRIPQANIAAPIAADEYGTVGYFTAFDSSIWYSTNYGRMLVSHDLGLTWDIGSTPYDSTATTFIPSLAFKDKMNGKAILLNTANAVDAIIATTDGGITWTTERDSSSAGIFNRNAIAYVKGTTDTWFVTSANFNTGGLGSAYTEDGGATWIYIDKIQHTSIQFNDIDNGWSGGFNTSSTVGGIFKWGSVRQPDTTTTDIGFTKADQNALRVYPNPSEGTFYIRANVEGTSNVRVYDMTGRIVFEETYPTQSLLLTSIDLSNISKGLYLVELNYNGKKAAQRVAIR